MSPVEALAQIRALMTEPGADGIYRWKVGHVRRRIKTILDAVSVDATPAQDIDREVTIILNLLVASGSVYPEDVKAAAHAILALVRPVEGVVLDEEQASLAAQALRRTAESLHHHIAERMISAAVYIEQGARLVRPRERSR